MCASASIVLSRYICVEIVYLIIDRISVILLLPLFTVTTVIYETSSYLGKNTSNYTVDNFLHRIFMLYFFLIKGMDQVLWQGKSPLLLLIHQLISQIKVTKDEKKCISQLTIWFMMQMNTHNDPQVHDDDHNIFARKTLILKNITQFQRTLWKRSSTAQKVFSASSDVWVVIWNLYKEVWKWCHHRWK